MDSQSGWFFFGASEEEKVLWAEPNFLRSLFMASHSNLGHACNSEHPNLLRHVLINLNSRAQFYQKYFFSNLRMLLMRHKVYTWDVFPA